MRDSIDPMASSFVRYDRGQFRTETELAISNLFTTRVVIRGSNGYPSRKRS
jgi:hypothetical protein